MEKVSQQGTEKWVKKSVTYTECRPKGGLRKDNGNVVDPDYIKDKPERLKKDIPRNPAQCECDHLLEANEIVEALTYYDFNPNVEGGDQPSTKQKLTSLSTSDAETLCHQPEYKEFLQGIEDIMNSGQNMRPLFNNPNLKKSNLIDPLRINKSTQNGVNGATATKLDPGIKKLKKSFEKEGTPEKAYMAILDAHMKATQENREATAKEIDDLIANLEFKDTDAAKIWKKMDLTRRVAWKNIKPGSASSSTRSAMYGRMQDMNNRALSIYDVKVQLTSFRQKPVLVASQKKPHSFDDDSQDGDQDDSNNPDDSNDQDHSTDGGDHKDVDDPKDGGDSKDPDNLDKDKDESKDQGKSKDKDQSKDTDKPKDGDSKDGEDSESDNQEKPKNQDTSKDEDTSKSKGALDQEENGEEEEEEEGSNT